MQAQVQCAVDGALNPSGARFCGQCGGQLTDTAGESAGILAAAPAAAPSAPEGSAPQARTLFYRLPRRLPPYATPVMVAAGGVLAALLAVPYDLFVHYNPLVYFTIFAPLVFGGAIGIGVGTTANALGVRHPLAVALVAGFCGFVGEYVAWVVWIAILTNREVFLVAPDDVWRAINVVAENTSFTVGKITRPSSRAPIGGGSLLALYVVEAFAVAGAAVFWAHAVRRTSLFCARCSTWAQAVMSFVVEPLTTNRKAIRAWGAHFLEQPLVAVEELEPAALRAGVDSAEVRLEYCEGCEQLCAMTLYRLEWDTKRNGETELKRRSLLPRMLIDRAGVLAVVDHIKRRKEALLDESAAGSEERKRTWRDFHPPQWKEEPA